MKFKTERTNFGCLHFRGDQSTLQQEQGLLYTTEI